MLMATAALIAGLVTAGAGAMGYSAMRQQNPPRAGNPVQGVRQPVAAPQGAQGPPRPAATKPAADQGPLMMQVEVVDPEEHRLSGADIALEVLYASNSGSIESVFERTRTDGDGQARLEVARERPGAS